MNVLVADKFDEKGLAELRQLGFQVTCEPTLQNDALREAVVRTACDVLVVRSTKVPANVLVASDRLALVVRAGAGYNTIDVETACKQSIMVANCPGRNAVAVAELTVALLLALDRQIVDNVLDLRRGVWNKKKYAHASGLKGRTLGILGFGQIGQAVARRAQAFGMPVVVWSRSLTPAKAEELGVTHATSPSDVAKRCDVLSVHLAATPETRGLVDATLLSRLKPGCFFINTSRADVVDYDALRLAIAEQDLRVGLDVYPNEPGSGTEAFADPIVHADGVVYGTHHIGASTDQAQEAIAAEAVRIVQTFHDTGRVLNCVNLREPHGQGACLRVRHVNKPGVLASVLGVISEAGINVEEMENVICAGSLSACAQIKIESPVDDTQLANIRGASEHILSVGQSV